MKILYLHQYFNTPAMAGGTRSYEMARRLVAAGHEVHMITTDTKATSNHVGGWRVTNEHGINVHWVNVPYDNKMAFNQRLRAFVRFAWLCSRRSMEVGGDVVFATSTPLTIALPAIAASRRLRIPMVFEVRDLWPRVPIDLGIIRNPVLKWAATQLELLAYRNSARIVALAPGMKEAVVSTGYPADRVTVIPNGADLDIFGVGSECGQALRSSTPWLGNRPMLVYCGALGAVNGTEFLVRLAEQMRRLDPSVCFVVIGQGREEQSVRERAAKAGVLDDTFFMLGSMPKKDLPAWLSASSMALAFISGPRTLWSNATQNKFFDALAAGKPVACNFRGFQSIVAEEAGCGLILNDADPAGSARVLLDHVTNGSWLEKAGAQARKLAIDRFDRNRLAGDLLQTLEIAVHDFTRQRRTQ